MYRRFASPESSPPTAQIASVLITRPNTKPRSRTRMANMSPSTRRFLEGDNTVKLEGRGISRDGSAETVRESGTSNSDIPEVTHGQRGARNGSSASQSAGRAPGSWWPGDATLSCALLDDPSDGAGWTDGLRFRLIAPAVRQAAVSSMTCGA